MAEAVQPTKHQETTKILSPQFSRVAFSSVLADEIGPLLQAHYLEVAHYGDIPLNVDWGKYQRAADMGVLRIFTIRHGQQLQGYACFFVTTNPHYSTSLQAAMDVLYLDPTLRGKLIGIRFIKWCDEQLKAEGVQVTVHHLKHREDLNYGPMLGRLGYEIMDEIWVKRLDK